MALTDTGKNDVLNCRFGGQAPPTAYYVRAHTASPGLTGANGSEVAATGYAPATVTNNSTNFPTSTANLMKNGTAISLGTNSSGADVTITHISFGKNNSGGTLLHVIALTTPKVVADGEVIRIPVDSFNESLN